ncbi:unnamed protein product, partial [Mesorhabditis belari]|uniref:Uncharacterized protein n=1 Tax=Mesorhabditis belari TaxID=2138241 RepID=A0AAF3F5Q3_9BILA
MKMWLWLWHPRVRAPLSVEVKDYRCCCGCMNSLLGFRILNFVLVAAWGFALLNFIVTFGQASFGLTSLFLVVKLFEIFVRFLAAHTLRPFYAQIYWIYFAFLVTFLGGASALGSVLMFTATNVNDYGFSDNHQEYVKQFREEKRHFVFGVLYIVYVIWQTQLTYSFYCYIRDRQLEIEERWETQQQQVETKRQLVKQEDEMAPPPYSP